MVAINLADIVSKIGKTERTGSLLCIDDQGKLGRIYFLKGRAVNARYDRLHGRKALDQVIQLRPKSTRFYEGRDMVRSKYAIKESPEAEITGQTIISNNTAKNGFDHSATALAKAPTRGATGNGLTPELIKLLRDELAKHIGPVAQLVIDDLDNQISLKDAVNTLATEIEEKDAAIIFINAMDKFTYS